MPSDLVLLTHTTSDVADCIERGLFQDCQQNLLSLQTILNKRGYYCNIVILVRDWLDKLQDYKDKTMY